MSFSVYILKCNDGSYYVGHTDNIQKRISAHDLGFYDGYTSTKRPLQLVFMQNFPTRIEALVAERKIKNWSRIKKESLINGDWDGLSQNARKSFKK